MIDYQRRVEVWLNDVNLQTAAPLAVVQYVNEVAPEFDLEAADLARPAGSRLSRRKRTAKEIRIGCVIGNLYDLTVRAQALDAIAGWARDGILKVSYRPNQQLRVIAGKPPTLGNAREWTQNVEISFYAYALPFWEGTAENERVVSLTTDGVNESAGQINPAGTAEFAPVEILITNTGAAAMTACTVIVGSMVIGLTGLNVAPGEAVHMYHDETMLFRIRAGTTELTSCRSASSDDELTAPSGTYTAVRVTTDAPATVEFKTRGLWL